MRGTGGGDGLAAVVRDTQGTERQHELGGRGGGVRSAATASTHPDGAGEPGLATGIPSAAAIGFLAGAFNIVPYLGPIIGALPAILLALTLPGALLKILLVVGIHREELAFGRAVAAIPAPIANAMLEYDFGNATVGYLRVENLLDEDYELSKNYGTAGRGVFGGVRVRF